MKNISGYILLIIACFFSFANEVYSGVLIYPTLTSIDVESLDDVNSTEVFIKNNTEKKVTLTIDLLERDMNEKGELREREVAPKEYVQVYPKQMILSPGEKRTVRVIFNGTKLPKREHSYILVISDHTVRELQNKKDNSGIKFKTKIITKVFVKRNDHAPEIKFVGFKFFKERRSLELTFSNKGKASGVIESSSIKIKAKTKSGIEKTLSLKESQIKNRRVYQSSNGTVLIEIPAEIESIVSVKVK